jgi:SAM-dependent methyltransferase
VEKKTGRRPKELEACEIPVEAAHIWGWFHELHAARPSSGFGPNPIKFPNGIYAYKNWLLPKVFNPEVFFDKHFVDELDDLQRVRGRDIIDAGAFIGDSALLLQDYTDKKVYAFDPNPKHIQKIAETIKLNKSGKIVPVPLGLGDKTQGSFMKA